MPIPFAAVGPSLALARWLRDHHQRRRKVRLTVHRGFEVIGTDEARHAILGGENYYVGVTNASHERDIEVTHMWFDTDPPLHIHDLELPKRLRHSARFETAVPVGEVPGDAALVPWLARCQLSPDDTVVKSVPRKDVPAFGTVPRG